MATIDEFKAYLEGGGARANQFRVTLTSPVGEINGELASFLVKTTSLPGQTITDVPVNYRGRILYVAGDRTFDPWTTTVINDTNFELRNGFESWMNRINELRFSTGVNNVSDYTADLTVTQLDRDDNPLKRYIMRNCWPTNVGSIELNYDTVSDIETFEVSWRYTHFQSVGVSA